MLRLLLQKPQLAGGLPLDLLPGNSTEARAVRLLCETIGDGGVRMLAYPALIEKLRLPFNVDVANDPFFGRAGKLQAESQREQALKFELLIPVNPGQPPTACASFHVATPPGFAAPACATTALRPSARRPIAARPAAPPCATENFTST